MEQQTQGTFDAFRPDRSELEWLEYLLENGDELDKPKVRRRIQAYKSHMKKCDRVDLVNVDPFGVVYECRTCGERVHSSRYLVNGLSVVTSGGYTKSGRLKKGTGVLDTFTGVWHGVNDKGTIPHDNRCHHCGQDMTCLDQEVAAETFDPKSPVG